MEGADTESFNPQEQESDDGADKQCRICLDGANDSDSKNLLIRPCKCRGTMAYIHQRCLELSRNSTPDAWFMCPTCLYRYRLYCTSSQRCVIVGVVTLSFAVTWVFIAWRLWPDTIRPVASSVCCCLNSLLWALEEVVSNSRLGIIVKAIKAVCRYLCSDECMVGLRDPAVKTVLTALAAIYGYLMLFDTEVIYNRLWEPIARWVRVRNGPLAIPLGEL